MAEGSGSDEFPEVTAASLKAAIAEVHQLDSLLSAGTTGEADKGTKRDGRKKCKAGIIG